MAALEGLYPLKRTINGLLESPRISIKSPSREILQHALYGVRAAVRIVDYLSNHREDVGSKTVEVLDEIGVAASILEDALDSHVSDQLSEDESIQRHPFLVSVDLEGVKHHIDGFTLWMKYLKKLFIHLDKKDEYENESFMAGVGSDESCGHRTRVIDWYASKAASMFSGRKADYIQELDSLLPTEEEQEDRLQFFFYAEWMKEPPEIFDDSCTCWWIKKAASAFMMMGKGYNPSPEEEEEEEEVKDNDGDDYAVSPTMVGLTDQFCQIRDSLLKDPDETSRTTIWGMAGLGKTALAMKILQDPLIASSFESRIFVRIGPKYDARNVVKDIIAQLEPHNDTIHMEEDKVCLHGYLWDILQVRKILIVFDDVWNQYFLNDLKGYLPSCEYDGECRFLVTTRLNDVARFNGTQYFMRFLNDKESWDLLQEKVFVGEACPRELEKAGKQIAENCEGLPLLIITVADLLSKAEKTKEYWSRIASSKKNPIFIDAYEKISKVLYPSYDNLPQDLKTCFLYLGAFPQNNEVRISKLINLWSAEGLRHESYNKSLYNVMRHFNDLVSNSVALETQRSSYYNDLKACTLHSVFWYLSKKEAWNEKFLHVLDSHLDASVKDIEIRPRLSVYKNSIFSIKAVHHSLASISRVRSLLCTGPYHPYQVPIFFHLRLLKVLDALSIRFYKFPLEVLKLLHLRYLALTCNGNLPPSIFKLWNLQCLIVHQHQSIKSSISESYLPVEIWDLLELEYLQIKGRNLPDPPHGAVLENLLILLDVGAHTCTKRVLESIPNLKKLRVQIELTPGTTEPLSFFDEISHVKELQCVIVNPEIMFVAVAPAPLVSASCIVKLTLSGFGYPWKDIRIIAALPHLEVLKLRCYAFKGEEWEVGETEFPRLNYFAIEDTDLVKWTCRSKSFPQLKYLTIKNCYKLQEIPQMPRVREIRVVDCNPSAVTSAKQMAHKDCLFYVDSSWLEKGKSKVRRQLGSEGHRYGL